MRGGHGSLHNRGEGAGGLWPADCWCDSCGLTMPLQHADIRLCPCPVPPNPAGARERAGAAGHRAQLAHHRPAAADGQARGAHCCAAGARPRAAGAHGRAGRAPGGRAHGAGCRRGGGRRAPGGAQGEGACRGAGRRGARVPRLLPWLPLPGPAHAETLASCIGMRREVVPALAPCPCLAWLRQAKVLARDAALAAKDGELARTQGMLEAAQVGSRAIWGWWAGG